METLFALIVSSVASYIGWWLGEFFGFGAAFLLSTIASIVGYYFAIKLNREYFC